MALTRRLARPLMASIFISGGLSVLRDPHSRVPAAGKVVGPLSDRVALPGETADIVRANAAVQVGAGVLFALGRMPRLAALVLLGSLVPTTIAGHRFWEESAPEKKQAQQVHFFKNLAMIGGLLLAVFDTEGSPSLSYRARRRASRAAKALPIGS
jgi:uncharacterized membrane protein YphA (DoxX/SURF4 family)